MRLQRAKGRHMNRYMPIALLAAAASAMGQTSTQPAEKRVIVLGQLYNHVGAGVPEATVRLTRKDDGSLIDETTTNEYGDFAIESEKDIPGAAVVTFAKKYFKSATAEVQLGGAGGPPFVDHEMLGAIVLAGTIKDNLKGTPIASATVTAKAGYKDWSDKTKEDGGFSIDGLLPGKILLVVEADGYARLHEQIEEVEVADLHVLLMKPERIVHLKIVDEASNGIGGVNVESLEGDRREYRHSLTEDDGRLTLRGLSIDSVELALRLSHEGYVSDTDFDRVLDLPADNPESTHEWVMKRAGIIVGTVQDAEGEPRLGARLTVGPEMSDYAPRAWSEFDGSFRITGVAPGTAVVTIHYSDAGPQLHEVQVAAGQEAKLDVKLSPGRSVAGTVQNDSGEPLPGVHVMATGWRGHNTLGLQALTDEQGRFEIIDAPSDGFEVALYLRGYEPLVAQTIGSDADANFTMKPDAGRSTASSGPATGAQAPDITVTTLDGKSIQLADLRGKIVLLDFWATWCGPCVEEVPHLVELHKELAGNDNLVMLSVSLDHNKQALTRFIEARKMNWLHVFGDENGAQKSADAYGVVGIPALFLIGPDGRIAAANLRGASVMAAVKKILDDKER